MNNENEQEQAQQASHREDERDSQPRSSHDEATEQRRLEPQPEYDSFMRIIRR